MKGLFKQWNKRNLTPIGKITVVKSLILPVLNFISIDDIKIFCHLQLLNKSLLIHVDFKAKIKFEWAR
jgi:hypothetical protein